QCRPGRARINARWSTPVDLPEFVPGHRGGGRAGLSPASRCHARAAQRRDDVTEPTAARVLVDERLARQSPRAIDGAMPLLRPSELARVWELHPKTVYAWIKEGKLPAIKTPGSQYRL